MGTDVEAAGNRVSDGLASSKKLVAPGAKSGLLAPAHCVLRYDIGAVGDPLAPAIVGARQVLCRKVIRPRERSYGDIATVT
jgi:hypothetical protein